MKIRAFLRGTCAPVAVVWGLLLGLGGCAQRVLVETEARLETDGEVPPTPMLSASAQAMTQQLLRTPAEGRWALQLWPGKRLAAFEPDRAAGRDALRVDSRGTVSVLRQRFEPALAAPGQLRFAWKAQSLPRGADLRDASKEDAALRLVLAFDGDRSRLSERAQRLSDLSQALTGEPLPYATLVYVWSETEPVGTVIANPRTDRIRKLVVASGRGAWVAGPTTTATCKPIFERSLAKMPGPC